jgi:DNA modification methylase
VTGPRAPHPANELNELPGEEWLYFTKSVLLTAYPSELGHALRKRHGANKPPRLMARLIEFFTKRGELVLDPFAGVGGTLLGAAIARGPRRALGIELDPRWAAVYREVVERLCAERDGLGPVLADLGSADPGGVRTFDPAGCELRVGDALELLPNLAEASVDFVATDPPYTVQMPLTMAGGRLAEAHANRRTDYAMVTDDPADLANAPTHDAYLDAMERAFGEIRRVLRPGRYAAVIVRDAYQDGIYRFTGAELADRATRAGLVQKGDLVWYQAGTRLRPYGYPRAFVPNIAHQHIVVLRREPERPGRRRRGAR